VDDLLQEQQEARAELNDVEQVLRRERAPSSRLERHRDELQRRLRRVDGLLDEAQEVAAQLRPRPLPGKRIEAA
jgi:predicted nuclease with TOPRIM domain